MAVMLRWGRWEKLYSSDAQMGKMGKLYSSDAQMGKMGKTV